MNGDKKKIHFICNPEGKNSVTFNRKVTALDWKKIASIEVENVAHTSNVELLEELLSQIVFCKPEVEFDSQSADSAFTKVFKLTQVIIEHLLQTQDILESKYENALIKYKEVEDLRIVQAKEIQALKDTLSTARRELKRRKELLASAQSEVIGENKDEFDPCPYCSKRFLTSAYLLSHMQRRHQGLPLHPVFPAQSIYQGYAPKFIENDYHLRQKQFTVSQYSSPREIQFQRDSAPPAAHSDNHGTQTEKPEKLESTGQQSMNLETISALVEQCLKNKSLLLEKDDKTTSNQQNANGEDIHRHCEEVQASDVDIKLKGKPESSVPNDGDGDGGSESVKQIMAEIKHQLDLQWKYLSGRINEAGLEELKSLVVNEPGVMDEISLLMEVQGRKVLTSPYPRFSDGQNEGVGSGSCHATELEIPRTTTSTPTPSLMAENVEERFQKQQKDLAALKEDLQSKMQKDMIVIESKLESQERYWRSKLRLVEDEYSEQFAKLRQEFQTSLQSALTHNIKESSIPSSVPLHSDNKPTVNTTDLDEHPSFYEDPLTSGSPGLVTYQQLVTRQNQQPQIISQDQFQSQIPYSQNNSNNSSRPNSGQKQLQQNPLVPRITTNRNQNQAQQSFQPTSEIQQKRATVVTDDGDKDDDGFNVSPKSTQVDTGPLKNLDIMYNQNNPIYSTDILSSQPITTVQTKVLENPIIHSVPIAKPRSVSVQASVVRHKPKPMPNNQIENQNSNVKTTEQNAYRHEYEEPDDVLKLDEVEEYSHSNTEGDETYYEDEEIHEEVIHIIAEQLAHQKSPKRERKEKKPTPIPVITEDESNVDKIRKKVKSELKDQLQSLGLSPADGAQIDEVLMETTIKKLNSRRESAIEEAPIVRDVRDKVMKETQTALLARSIQDRLGGSPTPPQGTPEKASKSPLVKMISAFKTSGKIMHKKVKSAIHKKPKQRKSPTMAVATMTSSVSTSKPPKKGKSGFFSRARWGRGKNTLEKPSGLILSPEEEKPEENGTSDTDSESGDSSATSQPDVEVHYITKPLQSSTPLQTKTEEEVEEGSSSSSSYETEDECESASQNLTPSPTHPLAKKKLTVKDNKASKLRYRESRKNAKAAAAAVLVSNEMKGKNLQTPPAEPKMIGNPFLVKGAQISTDAKDSKKLPVRRSLQAEFDHVTSKKGEVLSTPVPAAAASKPKPKPVVSVHQSTVVKDGISGSGGDFSESESETGTGTDDRTDIESSSSWDEMAEGMHQDDKYLSKGSNQQKQAAAGEYVKLAASKYTLERHREPSSSPENPRVASGAMGARSRRNSSGKGDTDGANTVGNNRIIISAPKYGTAHKPEAESSRPQTARTRVVMDSWDTDDDDDDVNSRRAKVQPQAQRHKHQAPDKPSLVSERWNDQPIYPKSSGKRTPMSVITAETSSDKHKRPASAKHTGKNQDPTDSPFNNSWDST